MSVAVAAAVAVADQTSKTWALHHTVVARHVAGPLFFTLTFNSGAAFGIGRGITPVVEAVVVVLVASLIFVGRRAARRASRVQVVALGLLAGGALSNLGDRLFRHLPGNAGAVIDFIQAARIGHHDYWPVFNVADASIVVGAIVLALSYSRSAPGRPSSSAGGAPGSPRVAHP